MNLRVLSDREFARYVRACWNPLTTTDFEAEMLCRLEVLADEAEYGFAPLLTAAGFEDPDDKVQRDDLRARLDEGLDPEQHQRFAAFAGVTHDADIDTPEDLGNALARLADIDRVLDELDAADTLPELLRALLQPA